MNQAQRVIVSVAAVGFTAWFWGACEVGSRMTRFHTSDLEENLGWFFATAGLVLYRLWKTKEGDE